MSTATKQPTTLKPGTQLHRAFAVERSAVNEEARTVELSFASETPYERWWGIEVLECTPTAMRLARLSAGGPFLMDHNTRDQIGVVESITIGTDRVARAVVRFSKSARANEIFQDVIDGIRRNVSVGYEIKAAVLVETNEDTDTYRVTDWEPFEVSLVSVPADFSVGVGRSAQEASPVIPLPPQTPPANRSKESTMAVAETQAAPAAAPAAASAAAPAVPALISEATRAADQAVNQRVSEILAIGDKFERFGGIELARQAIAKGETVDQLRAHIMNAMTAAQTDPVTKLGLSEKEAQRFSVLKAIRALVDKTWKGAEYELECHNEILKRTGLPEAVNGGFFVPVDVMTRGMAGPQRRDLTVASATGGGNLVATNLLPGSFIDLLRARARVAQLGATMLPGLVGNVAIPKLTGAATAYWLTNESTAITESQQTVGQLTLAPKNLGAYTEISRQLMLQSTPAAESLVMNDLARVLALAIDLAAFEGSGSSGQPTGVSNTAGIGSVSGGSLGLAGIIEFQTDTGSANALADNSAYVTTPAVAGLLMQRQRFTSTDTPLWTGSVLDGLMMGFQATTSTQLTAATMTFGDWSQVVIGEWGMLEIALNPYANFTAAISGIRAIQTVDVGVRQAAAFSRATSIT